jgi:hypothetical protein
MNHQPSSWEADAQATEDAKAAPQDVTAATLSPRPVFMGDPANDAVWDLVAALTNELGATRARLDALERILAEQNTIPEGAVDRWTPSTEDAVARTHDYQAYIGRVYNTLIAGR